MKSQKCRFAKARDSRYVLIPKWWRDFYDGDLDGTMHFDYAEDTLTIVIHGKPKQEPKALGGKNGKT